MTDIILLDGGMGQELIHRAGDNPTPLWSTQVMLDQPDLVRDVHADFFAAGATIATTNTYAVHHDRLVGTGREADFGRLHRTAVSLAREARDSFGSGRIAGAIGPIGASYRADVHPGHDKAVALYSEIARELAPDCDLLICETVVSLAHARAVLEGARTGGKPVWIAISVDDHDGTRLRSGELVADVLPVVEQADAILVNCSAPEVIGDALAVLATGSLPFGAYANGFEQITSDFLQDKPTVDALQARRDFSPQAYAQHALGWVAQGATIVGGCCEVGPAHIAALRDALIAAGHRIV
ncbi:homocysteine S-methyltransferase [Cognatiyoonia koreensis]|uniref:Homocysteine S-methyltransferase n=1 Tax=Cognatiyoonia koreensis TaxID=364200 RepID=A0A1I0RWU3_9RHOB|nr:homocysteine S-methyltransferase family protein [Cognatiyoonia koreensis]SEW45859.1 homocysteine S-methyltransferase [Cognatiyoonia koreensis]